MKIRIPKPLLFFGVVALAMSAVVFFLLVHNYDSQQQRTAAQHGASVDAGYRATLNMFRLNADTHFQTQLNTLPIVAILEQAIETEDRALRDILRKQLRQLLDTEYQIMFQQGLKGLHFVFQDGTTFYRFHNPSQHSDSIFAIRPAMRQAIEQNTMVVGMEGGRSWPAYRHIYPLQTPEGKRLGIIEISLPFDIIQRELVKILPGFAINLILHRNESFDKVFTERQDLFTPSRIHADYFCENEHVSQSTQAFTHSPLAEHLSYALANSPTARARMDQQQSFSLPILEAQKGYIATFLAIEDLNRTFIGYVVALSEAPILIEQRRVVWGQFFGGLLLAVMSAIALWFVGRSWETLEKERQKLAVITDTIPDGLCVVEHSRGTVTLCNRGASEILGYPPDMIIGQVAHDLFHRHSQNDVTLENCPIYQATHQGESFRGEVELVNAAGHVFPAEVASQPIYNTERSSVLVFRDITARKEAEENIRHLAFYDALTSLPNRHLLLDRLGHAAAGAKRNSQNCALLLLDLDHFKNLNDTQGHAIGDQWLVEIARRFLQTMRKSDTVARLGGDEFAILLEDLGAEREEAAQRAERTAEKILDQLDIPFTFHGDAQGTDAAKVAAYRGAGSIGITLFSSDDEQGDTIIKHAEMAMYTAKESGRGTTRFFDPTMQTTLELRAALERDLRRAIDAQEFLLYFQPQVNENGGVIGAEALVRWQHPTRGLISPTLFIPIAEETGLIVPIGRWVLEAACQQLRRWQECPSTQHLFLSVNVSHRQFGQPDFVEHLQTVVHQTGIDPAFLKLELTESMVHRELEATIERMYAIQAMQISFSMDDFGTGYSCLSSLKRLPLNQLKVDKSFVDDIPHDPNAAAIVRTIVNMGQILGLEVIAEGVETEEQRQFLQSIGCRAHQGYLFGKPRAVMEPTDILK
ncbi:bifunctional diguanylate cyclase/phosphodiesterase [Chrysiogenes arsenatis]|uniref:bifunctional diguanylate cyclase/phosphodiesterase n=1 Tax=Chrysiogenes arsenatis TaxID=309797 RepID=UPI000416B59A|nr:EAL domain-containing protein [Chrysiogenes arsenatis]